mgnify:CR=1 FL=1
MCNILILMSDITHANQFAGDPISVVPDKHEFSEAEDRRKFITAGNLPASWPNLYGIILIPKLPVGICRRLLEFRIRKTTEADLQYFFDDSADRNVYQGNKRWRLGINDKLTGPQKRSLKNSGFLKIQNNRAVINALFIDRQGLDVALTDSPRRM